MVQILYFRACVNNYFFSSLFFILSTSMSLSFLVEGSSVVCVWWWPRYKRIDLVLVVGWSVDLGLRDGLRSTCTGVCIECRVAYRLRGGYVVRLFRVALLALGVQGYHSQKNFPYSLFFVVEFPFIFNSHTFL